MDLLTYFNLKESYELPTRLLAAILDTNERERLCDMIVQKVGAIGTQDFMRDMFQSEQGDRDKLKQDYTPDCICRLFELLMQSIDGDCADICGGTGALTLATSDQERQYYIEELSTRAIPFLLLNLSIRNMKAVVNNCDSVSGESQGGYVITPGAKYSSIEKVDTVDIPSDVDVVVSNPPYSLKFDRSITHEAYAGYEPMPTNAADFAFLLRGMHLLNDNGTQFVILPHGILFRGNKEAAIRKKLIESNLLDAVIGLPTNLFMNTSIPVCVLVLKKDRTEQDILFIDASKDFQKQQNTNTMTEQHLQKLVAVYTNRLEVERYSHKATVDEIEENDFNLNIPGYVDTYIPEEVPCIEIVMCELSALYQEEEKLKKEIADKVSQLLGANEETERKHRKAIEAWKEISSESTLGA